MEFVFVHTLKSFFSISKLTISHPPNNFFPEDALNDLCMLQTVFEGSVSVVISLSVFEFSCCSDVSSIWRFIICPINSSFICSSSHNCLAILWCSSSGLWRYALKSTSSETCFSSTVTEGQGDGHFRFPSIVWPAMSHDLRKSGKGMVCSSFSAADINGLILSLRTCSIHALHCSSLLSPPPFSGLFVSISYILGEAAAAFLKNECLHWNHLLFSSGVLLHWSLMLLRWGFHQSAGKVSEAGFSTPFTEHEPCVEVMTCSGLCSILTCTRSVTREDWLYPSWPEGVMALCHWSNILTTSSTDFITGRTPFA